MGNVSSLTAYMDSLGPPKAFTPEPYLCAEADTLTMYFQNTPSRAERVNNFLTVFKAFDSDELVGFELKGILKKMEELGSMISVFTAKTRKVHIKPPPTLCAAAAVLKLGAENEINHECCLLTQHGRNVAISDHAAGWHFEFYSQGSRQSFCWE